VGKHLLVRLVLRVHKDLKDRKGHPAHRVLKVRKVRLVLKDLPVLKAHKEQIRLFLVRKATREIKETKVIQDLPEQQELIRLCLVRKVTKVIRATWVQLGLLVQQVQPVHKVLQAQLVLKVRLVLRALKEFLVKTELVST
jgi:hypothetical protein